MINKINKTLTLSIAEQKICKFIANARFKNARTKSIPNSKIGGQDDEFTDLNGFGGEMVFCRLHNVYPDFSVDEWTNDRGQDKGDCILYDKVIDVKTTKYLNGKLATAPWKDDQKIDFYALMVGTFPTYTFKGFISKDELIQKPRLGYLGAYKGYIAKQEELINIHEMQK